MSDCDFTTAQAEYHAALEEQTAIAEKVHDAKVRMLELDRRKRTMSDRPERG